MSITSETRANALLAVPRKLLDDYLTQAAEQIARRRMVVGEQIRKAREAKHWKQKELAVRVHVEPQTISNWERGVRVPDWEKIEILARELDQPLTYFVADSAEAAVIADSALAARVEALSEQAARTDEKLDLVLELLQGRRPRGPRSDPDLPEEPAA
jgi:transcriptional regulator with XRE-family HTH domain